MEPKVPEDIYKTHLENKGMNSILFLFSNRNLIIAIAFKTYIDCRFTYTGNSRQMFGILHFIDCFIVECYSAKAVFPIHLS